MKLINEKLILLDEEFKSKNEVLKKLSTLTFDEGIAENRELFLEALESREQMGSTAMGYDIGLPHGKSKTVTRPGVIFIRLKKELLWDEDENEKVKLIFMLAIPESEAGTTHINILRDLSIKLLDDDFRDILSKSNNKNEIMNLIN